MKITAGFGLFFVVCAVQPAIAENRANAYLLSLAPDARATMLAKIVGEGCVGKTTFYMGSGKTGFSKDKAFWSVRCGNSKAYMVMANPDGTSSVLECTVLKAVGGGECFKTMPE